LNAFRVHLVRTALLSLAFTIIFSTWMVYQIQVIKLDAFQLVLMGTILQGAIFVFEIPTGIVADVYSRRLSVIIGTFIMATAFLSMALIPTFAAALVTQFLWGFGYTFTSGAYDAWIVDELGVERTAEAFLRADQIGRVTSLIGIPVSAVLASTVALNAPMLCGTVLMWITAIFLLVFMRENGFTPTPAPDRTTWQKWGDTFRSGLRVVRSRPTLISILAVGLFFGLFSEGWDRLWQKHLIENITLPLLLPPVLWISLMGGVHAIVGIVIVEVLQRRFDTNNRALMTRTLLILTALMVMGIIVFGLTQNLPVALVAFYVFSLSRGLTGPLLATWTNQHIESQVRATVLSMQSQTTAIGQIAGGLPIGLIGQSSLQLALVLSGGLLSPSLGLLYRVWNKEKVSNSGLITAE
jgi:DHA3 family tetracycline resistance protein-like MFS transporter